MPRESTIPNSPESPVVAETAFRPRVNGWSCPWHPLQVLAWVMIILYVCLYYGFLVFYLPKYWIIAGYIISGCVLIIHAVGTIVTCTIDPADRNVRNKLRRATPRRGVFDPSQHEHVIEELHCHLCDVDVTRNCKHCRLCDKCVADFDHHCKWLNTCIGSRNYRWFFITVLSALLGSVMMLLLSLTLFVMFFAKRDGVRFLCDQPLNVTACDPILKMFGGAIPDAVFPTSTIIMAVLSFVATLLLGYLASFHVYLSCKGMTTYDYITQQRNDEETKSKKGSRCSSLGKTNRVTPTSNELGDITPDYGLTKKEKAKVLSISSGTAETTSFSRTPPTLDLDGDGKALSQPPCGDGHVVTGGVIDLSEQHPAASASVPTPFSNHQTEKMPPVNHVADRKETLKEVNSKNLIEGVKCEAEVLHVMNVDHAAASDGVSIEPAQQVTAVNDEMLPPIPYMAQGNQSQGDQHCHGDPSSQTKAEGIGNAGTGHSPPKKGETGTVLGDADEQQTSSSCSTNRDVVEKGCTSSGRELAESAGKQDPEVVPTPSLCSLSPSLFEESHEVQVDGPNESLDLPLPVPSPLVPSELLSSLTSMESFGAGCGRSMNSSPTPSLLKHSKKVTFDPTSSQSSFSQLRNSCPSPDLSSDIRHAKRALPPRPLLPIGNACISLEGSSSNSLLHTSRLLPPLNLDDTSLGSKESLRSSNASLSEPRYTRRAQKLFSSRSLGSLESSESGDSEMRIGVKGKKKRTKKSASDLEHKLSRSGLVGLAPLPEQ